ncbi:MAG: DUF3924 family protein [Patescibacteria group bacterium]|nr:DUF3924 family protein [Patescibacteria group bacterium]
MTNLNIELNSTYKEKIDFLKQVIPNKDGSQIKSDGELLETIVDEFIAFVEQHAANSNNEHEHNHE